MKLERGLECMRVSEIFLECVNVGMNVSVGINVSSSENRTYWPLNARRAFRNVLVHQWLISKTSFITVIM